MALTTFSQLKTSIANYLNRSDLTGVIPDFITLAESKLNRNLRLRKMQTTTTLTCVSGTATLDLPTDFLEVVQLYVDGNPNVVLDYVNPNEIELNNLTDSSGTPQLYTIIGDTIKLAPIPDSTHSVKLTYFQKIPALSDSNTTNFLLTHYPQIYLYGSLVESQPYIMNDERLVTWLTLYNESLNAANQDDEKGRYAGRTAFAMNTDTSTP